MTEPRITINGVDLSLGQAMTLRVALSDFHMSLNDAEFMANLGEIGPAYLTRTDEVLRMMLADDATASRVSKAQKRKSSYD